MSEELPAISPTEMVLDLVKKEREAQSAKWGASCHSPAMWLLILGRQIGHFSAAALDSETSFTAAQELIQIAAVAAAAAEDMLYGQAL